MLNSFQQAISFMIEKNILYEFQSRANTIRDTTFLQNWSNNYEFNAILERLEY
jgi:hypothetical protein